MKRFANFLRYFLLFLLVALMVGIVLIYHFGWLNNAYNIFNVVSYEVVLLGALLSSIGTLVSERNHKKLAKLFMWIGTIVLIIGCVLTVVFLINGDISIKK